MIVYGSNAAHPSPLAAVPAVSRELIGPGGGQVEGTQDAPVSPCAGLDAALADLDARLAVLEGGDAA